MSNYEYENIEAAPEYSDPDELAGDNSDDYSGFNPKSGPGATASEGDYTNFSPSSGPGSPGATGLPGGWRMVRLILMLTYYVGKNVSFILYFSTS